ncbi:MAG: SDR family oxidoreductase [Thermoflexales bacterium]|nr:SDR family oxidoreductase [Thermoflexales bacterium]
METHQTGRFALVTGAGSGIGRAATLALLAAGWHVALAGRRGEALEAVIAEAAVPTGRAVAIPADLRRVEDIDALFAGVLAEFGRLDLLFNNAGVSQGGPIEDVTLEQWQASVETNLTAPFLCAQRAFRIMKAQTPRGGRIINNGSISAHTPRPNSAPYTATKHAISGLTKSLALEGRAHDIACGQIDIGNALTDMTTRMPRGVPQANGTLASEPVMDVRHVGEAVLSMANLPLEANVLFMTVMATKMPYVGRG